MHWFVCVCVCIYIYIKTILIRNSEIIVCLTMKGLMLFPFPLLHLLCWHCINTHVFFFSLKLRAFDEKP